MNRELVLPDGDSLDGLTTVRLGFEAAGAVGDDVGRVEAMAILVIHGCVDRPDMRDRLDLAVIGRLGVLNQVNFFELERTGEVTAEVGQIRLFGGEAQMDELVALKLDPIEREDRARPRVRWRARVAG